MRYGIETCAAGILNNTDCDSSPTHISDTHAHVRNSVFLLQNMNLTVSHLTQQTLQQQNATQLHFFYVLLTVHLSIILATGQLNAQILVF